MKARLQGVTTVMSIFQVLFNCSLGNTILTQTNDLSKTLQNPSTSGAKVQETAHLYGSHLSHIFHRKPSFLIEKPGMKNFDEKLRFGARN